jgi:hypothetical protein
MSAISRFMSTARAILDEQDRKAAPVVNPNQPPFFLRTTWLFAELEELAQPDEAAIFTGIRLARLSNNIAAVIPEISQIRSNTMTLTDGRKRHERNQLCAWIIEQVEREVQP